MAGQASTAGVWPAMSTNVVHMAQSSVVGMVHAVRSKKQPVLSPCTDVTPPNTSCRICQHPHITQFRTDSSGIVQGGSSDLPQVGTFKAFVLYIIHSSWLSWPCPPGNHGENCCIQVEQNPQWVLDHSKIIYNELGMVILQMGQQSHSVSPNLLDFYMSMSKKDWPQQPKSRAGHGQIISAQQISDIQMRNAQVK